jgi:hypothetical protein
MVAKPTITHKCKDVYYKHSIPPTCFGHSCGHPKGDALQKMDTSRYCKKFVEQCTYVTYILLYAFVGLTTICNCHLVVKPTTICNCSLVLQLGGCARC